MKGETAFWPLCFSYQWTNHQRTVLLYWQGWSVLIIKGKLGCFYTMKQARVCLAYLIILPCLVMKVYAELQASDIVGLLCPRPCRNEWSVHPTRWIMVLSEKYTLEIRLYTLDPNTAGSWVLGAPLVQPLCVVGTHSMQVLRESP